jgi:hypothetical protein
MINVQRQSVFDNIDKSCPQNPRLIMPDIFPITPPLNPLQVDFPGAPLDTTQTSSLISRADIAALKPAAPLPKTKTSQEDTSRQPPRWELHRRCFEPQRWLKAANPGTLEYATEATYERVCQKSIYRFTVADYSVLDRARRNGPSVIVSVAHSEKRMPG